MESQLGSRGIGLLGLGDRDEEGEEDRDKKRANGIRDSCAQKRDLKPQNAKGVWRTRGLPGELGHRKVGIEITIPVSG
jgi:hypothetical protein